MGVRQGSTWNERDSKKTEWGRKGLGAAFLSSTVNQDIAWSKAEERPPVKQQEQTKGSDESVPDFSPSHEREV